MYRYLNVTGDLYLINLDWLKYTKIIEKGTRVLEFYNDNKKSCFEKKQTSKFLVPKKLRYRFGGNFAMKSFIGIEEKPPALEQFFKAAVTNTRGKGKCTAYEKSKFSWRCSS